MIRGLLVSAACIAAISCPPLVQAQEAAAVAVPAPAVPPGTRLRLMVTSELTSRTAHNGDRFKLRVDEPVIVNGVTVVPVGATAWAEVLTVEKNGAAGKGGKLSARPLHLELPGGNVPIRGEIADKGEGNGAGLALAVLGFGLFGLLNAGDSGRLKAGDIFIAYVEGAPPLAAPLEVSPVATLEAPAAPAAKP